MMTLDSVVERPRIEPKEISKEQIMLPSMWAVVLQNDNSTDPMYVVDVLAKVFNKSASEATKIMIAAHRAGESLVGIYGKDVAETKIEKAKNLTTTEGVNAKNPGSPCKLVFTKRLEADSDKE
jgi:ATP-dependent Clp protease adaptor protein ClpS